MVINVYTSQCMMHFKKNNFKPGCVCTRKNCCFLCSSKKFKNLGSKQKWNKIFSCFTISHTRVLSVLISPLSTFSRQHINTVVKTTETTVKFTCIYIYILWRHQTKYCEIYMYIHTHIHLHTKVHVHQQFPYLLKVHFLILCIFRLQSQHDRYTFRKALVWHSSNQQPEKQTDDSQGKSFNPQDSSVTRILSNVLVTQTFSFSDRR